MEVNMVIRKKKRQHVLALHALPSLQTEVIIGKS